MLRLSEYQGKRNGYLEYCDLSSLIKEINEKVHKDFHYRSTVADIIRHKYPRLSIYVGGHHIAVHARDAGERIAIIEGSHPDFS